MRRSAYRWFSTDVPSHTFGQAAAMMQTIRQTLPDGFQTAEFLLEHGIVDSVVPRADLKRTVGQLLRHMSGKPASAGWTTS